MSTKYSHAGQDVEPSPPASQSLQADTTIQEEKISPPVQTFPQLPQHPPQSPRNRWVVVVAVLVLFALILSVGGFLIAGLVQHPASQVKPMPTTMVTTPTPRPGDTIPTPSKGVTPGPQPSPPGIGDLAYWDTIIGTQKGVNHVESIAFANLMGDSSLQVLVNVRYTGTDSRLDVYVFTNVSSAHPLQIFKLSGLLKGDARISVYNTVTTAEVDSNSSINKGKPTSAMTPDLFREFQWSGSSSAFVQVAFPAIFPDLTRYQAEQDQHAVNQGHDPWKKDPVQVALSMAERLFQWSSSSQAAVLSGGGAKDVNAVVQVTSAAPAHSVIKLTLSRLEGNTNNLWVAISVSTSTMSITSPQTWATLTGPVTVRGTGNAFEGDVGTVFVLDHLYTDIGHAKGIPVHSGNTPFTATVSYTASFHGAQEGVLAYYTTSMADGSIGGVVLEKVLISG